MWRAILFTCAMALGATAQVNAQQNEIQPTQIPNQILVIDTDQLFNQSQFGQRVARELEFEGSGLRF